MRALLARRPEHAAGPLRRVLDGARRDDRPERLLRAAAAALLLGDVHAARTAGSRALAAARTTRCAAFEARALEYLAYGELRAGRHAQARAHAEEGVRVALMAGHRNTAASHHAMLALAASIEGDTAAVAGYASAALATARRHGLAQAATLAEWATARADLARGRPLDAADRLGPLVGPGPRRGHFAVWMLAVPCFVEAAVLAGQPEDARDVVADLARWAAFGADPHAPPSTRAAGPCSPRTTVKLTTSTCGRSPCTTSPAATSSVPAPSSCTAGGYGVAAGCGRRAADSEPPWSASTGAAPEPGPTRPGANCAPTAPCPGGNRPRGCRG